MVHVVRSRPTRVTHLRSRLALATIVAGAVLVSANVTRAADAEQMCLRGRYAAAAKSASCQQKVLGKAVAGTLADDKFQASISKCRVKYTDTWAKLRAKASGTGVLCDNERYDGTSAPATVIDRLTGLQWEQKTNDATVHDVGNTYGWSNGLSPADGPVFTSLLGTLNTFPCFAGHCDWRLPTIYELQTILLAPYPCAISPCIDDVFGPTAALYWSDTTHAANPSIAWSVQFFNQGRVSFDAKNATYVARAVRGGL